MNKLRIAFLSAIIFGISLFQNCFCTQDCYNSFTVLIFGVLGIVVGGSNLCWFANPFLFGSWISAYFNTKVSFIFSLIASIISAMFFFATEVAIDEAGTPRQIKSLDVGYWLWLLSIFIMLIGNGVKLYQDYLKNKNIA